MALVYIYWSFEALFSETCFCDIRFNRRFRVSSLSDRIVIRDNRSGRDFDYVSVYLHTQLTSTVQSE